jgi:hypothetical protein
MKIVENNETEAKELPETETPTAEIIQFKTPKDEEPENKLTVDQVLEYTKKGDLSDIIVIGRDKSGQFFMSAATENSMLGFFMVHKALFAFEHSLL